MFRVKLSFKKSIRATIKRNYTFKRSMSRTRVLTIRDSQLSRLPRRRFFWNAKKKEEAVTEAKKKEEAVTEEVKEVNEVKTESSAEVVEESASKSNEENLPAAKEKPYMKVKKALVLPSSRPLLTGVMEPFIIKDKQTVKYLHEISKQTPHDDIFVGVFMEMETSGLSTTMDHEEQDTDEEENEQSFEKPAAPVKSEIENGPTANFYPVGCLAQIASMATTQDGKSLQILACGLKRIEITSVKKNLPLLCEISHLKDNKISDKEKIAALYQQIRKHIHDLMRSKNSQIFAQRYKYFSSMMSNPEDVMSLADIAAYCCSSEKEVLQRILESKDPQERMTLVLEELEREKRVSKAIGDVNKEVEEKLKKFQREAILKEHLKKIKKELGMEKDEKQTLTQKYRARLEGKTVPENIMETIEEELSKFSTLETASSEFGVTRNYLDWLTIMPYGVYSEEIFNLKAAKEVLEADHYGMEDVKDRILEFIAVGKLKGGTAQGKIICLTGPPGVGKTSIGKSIARSVGREFHRFSVGGVGDISEIKGHRRTYVGAMPGKFAQALKRTGKENPLILIDEIDKVGSSHGKGEVSAALLEVLDPNQNESFLDHYLDVPLDLSKILFICTANDKSLIPGPLADRMEFVDLRGYILEEKLEIAKQYLVPKAIALSGLETKNIDLQESAITHLIRWYCREAGVRNLEKHIEKVYRKGAKELVEKIEILEIEMKEREAAREREAAAAAAEESFSAAAEKSLINEDIAEEIVIDVIDAKTETETGETIATMENIENTEVEEVITAKDPEETEEVIEPYNHEDFVESKEEIEIKATKKIETEAMKEILDGENVLVINSDNLEKYVGQPIFVSDRLYERTPVGTVMGLAYTSMGGTTLYVESAGVSYEKDKGGSHKLTGRLGETMSESAQIAYSFARAFMTKHYPENRFFQDYNIHTSVIEAATPKDGPSAGVTLATSLLSLALDKPVKNNVGMTGELSLTGRVLRIGGLREKVVAAKRSGCNTLFFPAENRKDWNELPDFVRAEIEVHFIANYKDLFDIVLGYTDLE